MMDVYAEIASARRELADYLDTLDDRAWQTQSLCSDWTVREVAGHLSMPLTTPGPKVMMAIVANGFNFHKAKRQAGTGESRAALAQGACRRAARQRRAPLQTSVHGARGAAHRSHRPWL
jgi:hypothetical protein